MDLNEELKKLAQSDLPIRQIREDAHFSLQIVKDGVEIETEVNDLSKGGVGVFVKGKELEYFAENEAVVLKVRWPEQEDKPCKIEAHVAWIKEHKEGVMVGFAFEDLSKELSMQIEHVLLDRIIKRTIEEDEE